LIAPPPETPWAIAGDFNEIIDATEKTGGAPYDPNRGRAFKEWIFNNSLIDVQADGPKFTWYGPKLQHYDRVLERLDRVICNETWRTTFHEATVSVISRVYSDHHPLLLFLHKKNNDIRNRPFRFEEAWFTHDKFHSFVKDNWNNNISWHNNMIDFTHRIKTWNNDVFGHIGKKKRIILNRLRGIQKAPSYPNNIFLQNLENTL